MPKLVATGGHIWHTYNSIYKMEFHTFCKLKTRGVLKSEPYSGLILSIFLSASHYGFSRKNIKIKVTFSELKKQM